MRCHSSSGRPQSLRDIAALQDPVAAEELEWRTALYLPLQLRRLKGCRAESSRTLQDRSQEARSFLSGLSLRPSMGGDQHDGQDRYCRPFFTRSPVLRKTQSKRPVLRAARHVIARLLNNLFGVFSEKSFGLVARLRCDGDRASEPSVAIRHLKIERILPLGIRLRPLMHLVSPL
jgi:hypothetical protein